MNRAYKNLANLLQQKIGLYDEFIQLLKTEWDIVTEHSLDALDDILKRKETLVLKLQVVEESRDHLVDELSSALNSPGLTLKQIIEKATPALRKKFTEYRERLLEQIARIRELNEKNRDLINHSSLSLKKSMVFVHQVSEQAMGLYQADGVVHPGQVNSRIVSTDV